MYALRAVCTVIGLVLLGLLWLLLATAWALGAGSVKLGYWFADWVEDVLEEIGERER